jgi:hypothetical protein
MKSIATILRVALLSRQSSEFDSINLHRSCRSQIHNNSGAVAIARFDKSKEQQAPLPFSHAVDHRLDFLRFTFYVLRFTVFYFWLQASSWSLPLPLPFAGLFYFSIPIYFLFQPTLFFSYSVLRTGCNL